MPQAEVEVVQAFVDAFNRQDWSGALALSAPDFELDLSRATGPEHGIYGLDRARRLVEEFAASWGSVRIESEEFRPAGDSLIVPMTMHAKGRDGIEVPSRVTWVWTIRDGLIVRASMYQTREDALAALGQPD